jgi:hypothetical protein
MIRCRTLFVMARAGILLALILLVPASFDSAQVSVVQSLPLRTRAQMIAVAKQFAEHRWVCARTNLSAPCAKRSYNSDWKAGQQIQGVPYRWGGSDTPEGFDRKLAQGLAAGSHSRDGVLGCATGVDCSGFVAHCWGLSSSGHDFSTTNLRTVGGKPKDNVFTDLRPGDALNKPGSHVVLFAGYNPDGTINVYEASGSAGRVIFHKTTWSRFKGYIPLRYKNTDE